MGSSFLLAVRGLFLMAAYVWRRFVFFCGVAFYYLLFAHTMDLLRVKGFADLLRVNDLAVGVGDSLTSSGEVARTRRSRDCLFLEFGKKCPCPRGAAESGDYYCSVFIFPDYLCKDKNNFVFYFDY